MKTACGHIAAWKGWNWVWGILVMLLPFTSVPFIVKLVHSDVVAAPSGLVLPLLLLGWALPLLINGKKISNNAWPLILFVLIGVLSTVVSFFYAIPEFKGQSPFRSSLSALLTLFVGFSFYLVSLLRHDSEKRLNFTFRLLDISGAIVCVWTLLQALCWYKYQRYPDWMKTIQFSLSVGPLYRQRFIGFALEPSWLAHQMNMLYLPFWFAASVSGYSAFSKRGRILTVERILFPVGLLVLFLTLSRVGLAAFLITAAFCALVFVYRLISRLTRNVDVHKRHRITILAFIGVILLMLATAWGILLLLVKYDFRMAGLFDIKVKGRSDPVFYFAEKLSLAARFVYWDGGVSIFNSHPLLGVGLGHAGFYLPSMLNNYAYRLIEVRDLLYRSQTLLNIKSLWIRVPAETGIVGFIFFLLWYLRSLLSSAVHLNDPLPVKRAAAWMGCFALLAFLLEGFSLDTFALPYLWFTAGLAASAQTIDAPEVK